MQSPKERVDAATAFIRGNGRLVEQRLFDTIFFGADRDGVVAAVGAYRNADGGFGHGLEPDKLCPDSQPLDVEIALERLAAANAGTAGAAGAAGPLVLTACDWLASLADHNGAVPILLPSAARYPRADHWTETEYPPDVNPTAGIAANVQLLGVSHPWVAKATQYCLAELEGGRAPAEAHALLGLSKLAESTPDQTRARAATGAVAEALATAAYMKHDPESDIYGLTPLDFAVTPDSIIRPHFDDHAIEGHLDQLVDQQQDDGGWPVAWSPPSDAALLAWRAIRTVQAVRTLVAYGRLPHPTPR